MIKKGIYTVLIFLLAAGCSSEDDRDPGTVEMAEILAGLYEDHSIDNPFANTARLNHLEGMAEPQDLRQKFQYLSSLGQEQLYAGYTREAIETFHRVETFAEENPSVVPPGQAWMIDDFLALAYLRLGEQENCIENPTSASCILPIRGEGVHAIREGSTRAIDYYKKLLKSPDGNLNHAWLMNIAYMTLDQYPEEVPEEWKVPESVFHPHDDFPFFDEIGASLGVDHVALSGGSIVDDFNGNGYLDILTSSWHLKDQVKLFVNNGDGTFTDQTEEAGLNGITGGLNMVHADYTNNGFPDVYVLRGAWMGRDGRHPNSLLKNNGDGTFSDVTFTAGVSGEKPTQTASWADVNLNGKLDLIVGYESENGEYPAEFFLNNGDGTFTNAAEEAGINFTGFVKAVVWGDYTNNGYPDLYVSRLGQENLLFENLGTNGSDIPKFREVARQAGVQEPVQSFPAWFWDFNNNGYQDLFVSGYRIDYEDIMREYLGEEISGTYPRLYKNNGDGTFTDVTESAGLDKVMYTMGTNFGDLNNNGFLDFYIGTGDPDYRSLMPNRMFENRGNETFREVTYSGGFGSIQKGHGVSFADMNHNGFQDIHVNMGGALEGDLYQNLFFKNPGNSNNWVILELVGEESNRAGLHSRVVICIEENGKEREIHRTVSSGGSFGGSPFRVEAGVGSVKVIREINVYWPASGKGQVFKNVEVNQLYRVLESAGELEALKYRAFDYKEGHSGSLHSHE